MRVAEAYGEAMFLTVRLEDLVPATHPLHPIRKWINNAVTEHFNATVEMARRKGLLSGEHSSVDGTLIQAWASHKSMRRKDGSDDSRPPENWRDEKRSSDTHASKTDPDSRLNRKRTAEPALPNHPIGPMRQVMVRGLDKVDQFLTLTIAAYNLTRLRTLAELRSQCW